LSQNNAAAPTPPANDVSTITIEEEMKRSYLDYAMSVIVSRALPDVRDGLKPVHRRILYAMKDGGYDSSKPYKKSARIVGDVMGKYHPHGDSAIYDAMVRMAQEFSMRLPLIDGQGNFGSMDGDPAAAMRYTEARLGKSAETLLEDIDKDTVDWQANYDESIHEPRVLPARFPNLLINGAGGIAVGMATNIPTHNLGEVIDGTIALINNPELSIEELTEIIPGPDFPTGGIIMGRNGVRSALHTGRGSVVIRARTTIEEVRKDRQAIIVSEIPYQVNKSRLIEIIASQVNDKVIEGISDLRDESDRSGVRIVIELKREAVPDIVLNQLYKHSPLQTSFGVNMLALRDGRPELLNIKQVLEAFLIFREQVITKRTEFELGQARDRAHILVGLAVAVANIDEVIALIRKSPDPNEAKAQLLAREWSAESIVPMLELVEGTEGPRNPVYKLSEVQAKAILDLRLHRLTGLERDKIAADLKDVVTRIADYFDILRNRSRVLQIMRDEMTEIRNNFATPRMTSIEDLEFEEDIEALIQREDMVVTVSHSGYVKRVPLSTYRAQKRGGKGRMGMQTKDEDFVNDIFIANTHTPMLFFSSRGMVYALKVYKLPLGNPQAKGKAFVNLLPLQQGETITATLRMPEEEAAWQNMFAMFSTASGTVRRNRLSDFGSIRQSGLIAMKLDEGDKLVSVHTCSEQDDVLLATKLGKSIRFPVEDIRVFAGRTSTGVRGIKLSDKDEVISMSILKHVEASPEERAAYLKAAALLRRAEGEPEVAADASDEENVTAITLTPERQMQLAANEQFILTVSAQGFGKRTSSYEYRISGRGGSGIWGMGMGAKNTTIMASFPVEENHDLMLVTNGGQLIRMPVKDIRIAGRATQGVTLFRVGENEQVVSAALIQEEENSDEKIESAPEGDA
jgi:DNA gyrase subunit A